MIHSFSCKNFYSFAEYASVKFLVNDKVPAKEAYLKSESGERVSKAMVVIGPNASGKTNLLKIPPFLKWLIVDSFNTKPEDEIPIKPFLFRDLENKPTELSVEFEMNGDIYSYFFALSAKRIIKEELKVKNKTKQKTTTKTLFVRNWNEKQQQYELNDKNFNLPKGFENENFLRSNASLIGSAMRLNHELSQEIGKYWQKIESNVYEGGLRTNHMHDFREALSFFSDNEPLKKEAEKLLARYDIGLEAFNITKEKKEGRTRVDARAVHSFSGHKYELPIEYESSGTRQLFILLSTILQVLSNGGIAVLDEFDVNLHPDMVSALFDLFVSPATNPHNAQIIFSTHSHRILSELDKYQIILTEKNENGSSEAWRLDEMSGVRADDNYYTKYIAGAYGAIPKID
ncbi:MAG: ATP-binding protein [Candidatus Gracilibacteria bacterium]|jgi:hypothetical protein